MIRWHKLLTTLALGAVSILFLNGVSADEKGKPAHSKNFKAVTFNKDVAPILYEKCVVCHRPGEAAPFSVLSYKEARPWARSIKEKVINREMPPWHADPHVGKWANDRRLTEQQIQTLADWVDQGAGEGNPKDLPPTPTFQEGWNIGKPDVVFEMPETYTVEASGPDEYQHFDVQTNFTQDKWVQMAEARPGNRKVVHHVVVFVMAPNAPNLSKMTPEMRHKFLSDRLEGTPFFREGEVNRMRKDQPIYNDASDVPMPQRVFNDPGTLLTFYAPGTVPSVWKPGTAKRIPAGAILRFQIHYSKVAGTVQKDRSMLGLIFAKQPPPNIMQTSGVANMFFQIPPQADNHKVTAVWTTKNDWTLYSLTPHMHYRGKAMEIKVTYPDGRSETVLNVPNYNFAWQIAYELETPLRIPNGSQIHVTSYYDNSAKNKLNPDPTKAVRFGEPTYDEMMIGWLEYVIEKPAVMAKVEPAVFDSYAGRYNMNPKQTLTVSREGDRFFVQATGGPRLDIFPVARNCFVIPNADARITFLKDDKGEVTEVFLEQGESALHWKRLKEGEVPSPPH